METFEVNFDGLVGPMHNYAGLSPGNVASEANKNQASHPKSAALQGLTKMRYLHDLGLKQGILPPHRRPALQLLRSIGFEGTAEEITAAAANEAPHLLAAACSSSAMWTANAATSAPSIDTGKLTLVPANLASNLHRSAEGAITHEVLKQIFPTADIASPLPSTPHFYDEGAANHTRLAPAHSEKGLHVFVYGADTYDADEPKPTKFPARQTKASCEALARRLGLPQEQVLILQQSPDAIDAGVFHNDVISTGNENVLLYHENAFAAGEVAIHLIQEHYLQLFGEELHCICVPEEKVSMNDAVESYLFNSQLITLPDGEMLLLAPEESQKNPAVCSYIEDHLLTANTPVNQVKFMDLRESMCNGGGPACLRLRVLLTEEECDHVAPSVWFTAEKEEALRECIIKHYPDEIQPDQLHDPTVLAKAQHAFDALETIFGFTLPQA